MDLLLKHGADVNVRSRFDGRTPLHMACNGKHADVAKRLIEAHAK